MRGAHTLPAVPRRPPRRKPTIARRTRRRPSPACCGHPGRRCLRRRRPGHPDPAPAERGLQPRHQRPDRRRAALAGRPALRGRRLGLRPDDRGLRAGRAGRRARRGSLHQAPKQGTLLLSIAAGIGVGMAAIGIAPYPLVVLGHPGRDGPGHRLHQRRRHRLAAGPRRALDARAGDGPDDARLVRPRPGLAGRRRRDSSTGRRPPCSSAPASCAGHRGLRLGSGARHASTSPAIHHPRDSQPEGGPA